MWHLANMISSICSFHQHTRGLILTNVYTSFLYQNIQQLCVFTELCLWIHSANFNGEESAAIQSPIYIKRLFVILTSLRNWRNRLKHLFSVPSLSEISHVSGKHPNIYQGNTERQPFLPPPFFIKNPGVIFIHLSPVTKGSELHSCARDSSTV